MELACAARRPSRHATRAGAESHSFSSHTRRVPALRDPGDDRDRGAKGRDPDSARSLHPTFPPVTGVSSDPLRAMVASPPSILRAWNSPPIELIGSVGGFVRGAQDGSTVSPTGRERGLLVRSRRNSIRSNPQAAPARPLAPAQED